MSKAKQGATKKAEAPERESSSGEVLGSGNLDQVREILFGAQSRGTDKRLTRLEEELPRLADELREEVRRSLEALETYAHREVESLTTRLTTEHKDRAAAEESAAARLDETAKAIRSEISELDERDGSGQRELRQQLLEQAKRFDTEIRRKHDELATMITRAVDELRAEKADRSVIAAILHEVAMRLTDELPIPLSGEEGS